MIPRYGTPGGMTTFRWVVNEMTLDPCIVYAETTKQALDTLPEGIVVWSIRLMADNE